jgi:hypothetical protein
MLPFHRALAADPVAVGTYLGKVALMARGFVADGESPAEAVDFAFGLTDVPVLSDTDAYVAWCQTDPSQPERDAVAILIA